MNKKSKFRRVRLRTDWHSRMHMALGYLVCEDDEGLRAFNSCIKGIIQSDRQRGKKNE